MNDPEQKPQRRLSHGELIEQLIAEHREDFGERPVFVETGCGISTLYLARAARRCNARVISCDKNLEKIEALQARAGAAVANVEFIIGDSLRSLMTLKHRNFQIHFLFLDAAASAMHTFLEFEVIKGAMRAGSVLLIDNAALPGETQLLSPCRKGRIIAPYLLASPYWEVTGHPDCGDSMISAVRHREGGYAHKDYEWPEYVDPWQWSFDNEWPKDWDAEPPQVEAGAPDAAEEGRSAT